MDFSQSSSIPSSKTLSKLKEDLICPITLQIMQKPMLLICCGQSFQKQVIQRQLTKAQICPLCRSKITLSQIIPNRNLQRAINTYKDMMAKRQQKKRKEQQKRRKEVQEQLKAVAGRRYSELVREGLQNGRKMTSEELASFQILPTSQKCVRLAIQQILESLRLQQIAKNTTNVSAAQALNFGQQEFARIITDL